MAVNLKARLLAEDIWDTPDDGNRYEVIEGEVYAAPPPVREHQEASSELHGTIWSYLRTNPIGRIYHAPLGEDGYGPRTVYGVGETFRPALFPGLAIEVAHLWP